MSYMAGAYSFTNTLPRSALTDVLALLQIIDAQNPNHLLQSAQTHGCYRPNPEAEAIQGQRIVINP